MFTPASANFGAQLRIAGHPWFPILCTVRFDLLVSTLLVCLAFSSEVVGLRRNAGWYLSKFNNCRF